MAKGPSEQRRGLGAGNIQVLAVWNSKEGAKGRSRHKCSRGGKYLQGQETGTLAGGISNRPPMAGSSRASRAGGLGLRTQGSPCVAPAPGGEKYSHHFFQPGAC